MAQEIVLSRLDESMDDGMISKWLVKEGDQIKKGDGLCEVESSKSAVVMESLYEGTILKIVANEGETYDVGTVLAYIGEAGESFAGKTRVQPSREHVESESRAQEITLSRLDESMDDGVISKWLVKEGDQIKKGDGLCEVESSKSAVVMESLYEGTILKIVANEGETYDVGAVLAYIGNPGDLVAEASAPATEPTAENCVASVPIGSSHKFQETDNNGRVFASPLARKLAKAYNLPLAEISKTATGCRITKKDVLTFLDEQKKAVQPSIPNVPETAADDGKQEIKYSSIRKVIASRMMESAKTKPVFVLSTDVIADEIINVRNQFKARGIKITVTAILVKAVCRALEKYPLLNAHVRDDAMTVFSNMNIGVAVGSERGLMVPVVHRAQTLGLEEIATEIANMSSAVQNGTIKPPQMQNGTFTISNLGMYSIDHFTAIINPPEAAILSVGKTSQKFVPDEKGGHFADVMTLGISLDHRAIDGEYGAKFMTELKSLLENPYLLL